MKQASAELRSRIYSYADAGNEVTAETGKSGNDREQAVLDADYDPSYICATSSAPSRTRAVARLFGARYAGA